MDQVPAARFEQKRDPGDLEVFQGETRTIIQPASLKDPKLEELKEILVGWINSALKREHIVVQSLEEDLYDGLVLHHLLAQLSGVRLDVEDIAVTGEAQLHKLQAVMEVLNQNLGLPDQTAHKWSVKLIHDKDLLATLHLLVAIVRRFQPDLALPLGVSVEVVLLEVSKAGIKSEKQVEHVTEPSDSADGSSATPKKGDPIEQLMKLDCHKINTVTQAILHFVNMNVSTLGLQVTDVEKQFADGVILLLLLGQLEGYFIPLCEYYLTPTSKSEMLHNVTLALDLLNDQGLQIPNIDPQDIVSEDLTATLKVLYVLFKKHKSQ